MNGDKEILKIQCSGCGFDNPVGQNFCGLCGAALPADEKEDAVPGPSADLCPTGGASVALRGPALPPSASTKPRSPLLEAIETEDLSALATCLKPGVNLHSSDRTGRTALHIAAERGKLEVGKWLLAQGWCVDARLREEYRDEDHVPFTRHLTPLMLAAAQGNLEMCAFLTSRGAGIHCTDADPEVHFSEMPYTVLDYAARAKNPALMKWLLNQGCASKGSCHFYAACETCESYFPYPIGWVPPPRLKPDEQKALQERVHRGDLPREFREARTCVVCHQIVCYSCSTGWSRGQLCLSCGEKVGVPAIPPDDDPSFKRQAWVVATAVRFHLTASGKAELPCSLCGTVLSKAQVLQGKANHCLKCGKVFCQSCCPLVFASPHDRMEPQGFCRSCTPSE